MTYKEAAFSILKSIGHPIPFKELAQKVLEIKPSKSKNPVARIQDALRTSDFIRFPDGKMGLEIWVLNGSIFRIVPTEEELESGELIISHDLVCLFSNLTARKKEAGEVLCFFVKGIDEAFEITSVGMGIINARVLGVERWFERSGFKLGDSILVKVLDAEERRYDFQREPKAKRNEDLIKQYNQDFADFAYKFLAGNNTASFGEIILSALASKPYLAKYPPDPYYDIISKDGRFHINFVLLGLVSLSNSPLETERYLSSEMETWQKTEFLNAIFQEKNPSYIPGYLDFLLEYILEAGPDDPDLLDLIDYFPFRAQKLFREIIEKDPEMMCELERISKKSEFRNQTSEMQEEFDEEPDEVSKVGRNDPCPCGSGKKYKRCCLPDDEEIGFLRSATDNVLRKLGYFAFSQRFLEDFEIAFYIFWAEEYELYEFPYLSQSEQVHFTEWYFLDYFLDDGRRIAEIFLQEMGDEVSSLERRALEDRLSSSPALYEVLEVEPGKGLRLKDIFSGEEYDVKERRGSRSLYKWDLVFTRVVPMGKYFVICGGLHYFPVRLKERVVSFAKKELNRLRRKNKGAAWEDLYRERGYLFNHLWMAMARAPQFPIIVTPEGQQFILAKAIYLVHDYEEVRKKLTQIPGIKLSEDEFVENDQAGISFNWSIPIKKEEGYFRVGENFRIMGFIELRGSRLKLECNSKERLENGKALLEYHLGKYIEHRADSFKDLDVAMEEYREKRPVRKGARENIPPEVEQEIARINEEQHDRWVDESVPVLGGKTPREAIKTKKGREKVEELLKQFENIEERRKRAGKSWYDINRLRKMLGLI